jgi:hypothetical protein
MDGSAFNNEYLSASWYELQIILNSGDRQHCDRTPIVWVYLIGHFHYLYTQSHVPEPVRLLIAVTKAFQATNPKLGPDDFSNGWRPDQGVDPRIMISEKWQLIFNPLSWEVRRALTESLLSAWLDKNLQYPITQYVPLPPLQSDHRPWELFRDISGGEVWNAAERFLAAGVSDAVVNRLRNWEVVYTDRATRIQSLESLFIGLAPDLPLLPIAYSTNADAANVPSRYEFVRGAGRHRARQVLEIAPDKASASRAQVKQDQDGFACVSDQGPGARSPRNLFSEPWF